MHGDSGFDRGIKIDGRVYRAHRVVFAYVAGEWPDGQLDHEDRNKDNNRLGNLRSCTNLQNQLNRGLQTNNRSGFKGVRWRRGHRNWCAEIYVSGKQLCLGYFPTRELAAIAYLNAALQYHGDFAHQYISDTAAAILMKFLDYPVTSENAVATVRRLLPNESHTVIANVAEALVRRATA
jgi:HNH endonuclease/AP2 domain